MYSSTLSLTSALLMGCVVSAMFRLLYPWERPGTQCIGGWMGPKTGLEECEKSRPSPGFDPRTVQLVASRYTDCAIPAHKNKNKNKNRTRTTTRTTTIRRRRTEQEQEQQKQEQEQNKNKNKNKNRTRTRTTTTTRTRTRTRTTTTTTTTTTTI